MKSFYAYIALSAKGYPAPTCGYALRKYQLKDDYSQRFGHSLEAAGYRIVRVLVQAELLQDRD